MVVAVITDRACIGLMAYGRRYMTAPLANSFRIITDRVCIENMAFGFSTGFIP